MAGSGLSDGWRKQKMNGKNGKIRALQRLEGAEIEREFVRELCVNFSSCAER